MPTLGKILNQQPNLLPKKLEEEQINPTASRRDTKDQSGNKGGRKQQKN